MHLRCFETKLPNIVFKTQPKQLLGSLLLDIALPYLTASHPRGKALFKFKTSLKKAANTKVENCPGLCKKTGPALQLFAQLGTWLYIEWAPLCG